MHFLVPGRDQSISPFELTFPLMTVILGLALTQMAASLHKLLLAGRRVTWAPEPILLALFVSLLIIVIWLSFWEARNETSATYGHTIVQVLTLLILYFTAASCLPEPTGDADYVDTYAYYDRTRILSFGSLLASYLIYIAHGLLTHGWPKLYTLDVLGGWILYLAIYVALIFIRARWFNNLALSLAFLLMAWATFGLQMTA